MSRWETLVAVDTDKWACEVYKANFPNADVWQAPVSEIIGRLPGASVFLAGPPCQGFSLAGEGKGEHDPRNGWPSFCRAVEAKKPRHFIAENVAGMLTERHIRYFGRVLARLEQAGYAVDWKLLNAVSFGVPQFRERVIVWGIRKDLYDAGMRRQWPKPTHAWPPPDDCMFGSNLMPGVTVGQALGIGLAEYHAHGFREGGPVDVDAPGPTMRSGSVPGCSDIIVIEAIVTGSQCRKDHNGVPRGPLVKDIQNPSFTIDGTPPNVHEYRWSDAMLQKHPPASPASPASPAPTVQAKWLKGGAEGLVEVHDDGWRKVRFSAECDPEGDGLCPEHGVDFAECPCIGPTEEDCDYVERKGVLYGRRMVSVQIDPKHPVQQVEKPAGTITSGGSGHGPTENSIKLKLRLDGRMWEQSRKPAEPAEPAEPAPTVRARSPRDKGRCTEQVVRDKHLVRRLTAQECGRLQSLPDDFKWPAGITKTAMYRIIGNGVACALAHHLAQSLKSVDPESITVASLFCGGGLMDVGWHGRVWRYEPEASAA